MRKRYFLIISLILAFSTAFSEELPRTGDRPMTPEEQAEFDSHAHQIIDPGISDLGKQRIGDHLGIPPSKVSAKPFRSLPQTMVTKPQPAPVPTYTLPPAVDNSTLNAFPPIKSQGSIGSCASFCTTYYMLTHMTALARGWDAKGGGNGFRFSTRLTYNMINGGNDSGSTTGGATTFIFRHGGLLLSEWAYDTNFRIWPTDAAKWRSALSRKISAYGTISGLNTEEGLNLLRQMIVNGYVLVFSTGNPSSEWVTRDMSGTKVVYMYDTALGSGGHAMTIVGYDDDLWCDVNNNTVQDPGETGALKIANSWGVTSSYGMNAGYYWISYDALRSTTEVTDWTPPSSRASAFSSASWMLAPNTDYRPELVCEFTVRHPERRHMKLSTGKADQTETEPETIYSTYSLRYAGGEYAFDGTTTVCDGSFVLDMSPLEPDYSTPMRYFFTMDSANGAGEDRILSMVLKDAAGTVLATAGNTPLDAADSKVHAYADLTYTTSASDTVTISATDPAASEFDLDPAAVRISRTSSSGDLAVNIETDGTAGVSEYLVFTGSTPVMGTVLIPDGQDYVDISIIPVDDLVMEDSETVIVSILRSADYITGTDSEAQITIADNDEIQIETSVYRIQIPENGTGTVGFRLTAQPSSDTDATCSVRYGDVSIVSAPTLTFTSSDWDTWQYITLSAPDDADTFNNGFSILVTSSACQSGSVWGSTIDDDELNIVAEFYQADIPEGTSIQCGLKLNSAPGEEKVLKTKFFDGDLDIELTAGEELMFDSGNWDSWQYLTFTSAHDLDGYPGDATFYVTCSGIGSAYITLSEDDDEPRSIRLIPSTTSCSVTEGGEGSFTIKLSGPPAAPYTVSVSRISGDKDITVEDGAVLDFNGDNWNTPQKVTLQAALDTDCEGGEAVIKCIIPGVASCEVEAAENDIDKVMIDIDPYYIEILEGSTGTMDVYLSDKPADDVIITISRQSGDTDLTLVSPSTLTFTTDNWDTPQTLTFAAAEDADSDAGFASFELDSPSAYRAYASIGEIENDTAQIVCEYTSLQMDEGTTETVGICLSADPGSSTTITSTLSTGTDVSITAGSSLTFDSGNWDVIQYVTLDALTDADLDNEWDNLQVTGIGTDRYINIQIRDADQPAIEIEMTEPITVPEEGTVTIRFRYAAAVPADTNISINGNGGDEDITIQGGCDPCTLTFTPADWDVWQTVTFEAADDADTSDGWRYFSYNGEWENGTLKVYEADNDQKKTKSEKPSCSPGTGFSGFSMLFLAAAFLILRKTIMRQKM